MSSDPKAERVRKFEGVGLAKKLAEDVCNNAKKATEFEAVIAEAKIQTGCDPKIGNLLFEIVTKMPASVANGVKLMAEHRPTLIHYVAQGKIKTSKQMDEAVKFLKNAVKWDEKAFNEACGVGIDVKPEQIRAAVSKLISENKDALVKERYALYENLMYKLDSMDPALKWAPRKEVKDEYDAQILKLLGPKTEEDNKARSAKKPEAKKGAEKKTPAAAAKGSEHKEAKEAKEKSESEERATLVNEMLDSIINKGRDLPEAHNTAEQLERHLKVTGGKIITRFPPEPNGFLHIGHAKASRFNFGVAKQHGGHCIMRFDDTNPDAEKKLYIDSILDNVLWLGHRPWKITYSSDYFDHLYEFAIVLIKKGLAYVDHQTKDEIKASRNKENPSRVASPYRNRPIEENLRLFEDMKKGKFEEGKATLRLKGDLSSPNPQMWDLVAYRIKYTPHPKAGDKWCIYPSYDYSHCIIDSLENITHSLCTLEFEVRREVYYWVLQKLDLYKPKVWEYSRLNLNYNVMSKRKLKQLVMDKYVSGWDDPRLLTINGLRRRGYTPEAINDFCDAVGVTRNLNTTVGMEMLEHSAREHLEPIARRAFGVLRPVKVVLTNWDEKRVDMVDFPLFPNDPSKGSRKVPLSHVVYIDQDDFRMVDSKDFYGLAPGKEVHLKYAYNIKCVRAIPDAKDASKIDRLECEVDFKNEHKCKGKLHWVAEPQPGVEPFKMELRLYDRLFKSEDPASLKAAWLADLNPNSLVIAHGYGDPSMKDCKSGDRLQFERVGFFCVDPDTKPGHLVFNLTVRLRDAEKKKTQEADKKQPEKKESKKKKEAKKDEKKDEKKQ